MHARSEAPHKARHATAGSAQRPKRSRTAALRSAHCPAPCPGAPQNTHECSRGQSGTGHPL
eukprot:8282913-Lingulodinium_polyedra.AAC.1